MWESRSTSFVALLVGIYIIFNSFTIAVNQRWKEIGILRAIGVEQGNISRMFLGEALACWACSVRSSWALPHGFLPGLGGQSRDARHGRGRVRSSFHRRPSQAAPSIRAPSHSRVGSRRVRHWRVVSGARRGVVLTPRWPCTISRRAQRESVPMGWRSAQAAACC